MKKQFLALIGGVMVAGLAMAAEVVGNNEAVVIQKEKVESATGFQFLCVPVAPLDITGGENGKLRLSSILPPESYPIGTTVTFTGGESSVSYNVQSKTVESVEAKHWCDESDNVVDTTEDNKVVLESGEIFWLNSNSLVASFLNTEDSTEEDSIVFCGQATEADKITDVTGIAACGNTSSEAKTLSELIDKPTPNSWVYVIEAGKTDYKQYQYDGTKWCTWNAIGIPIEFTGKIAAGEAFYYLKAQAE